MGWKCFYCGGTNSRDWWQCNWCSAPKREPRFVGTPGWEPDFKVPDRPYFFGGGLKSYEEKKTQAYYY